MTIFAPHFRFSALQRAEIAEIRIRNPDFTYVKRFSALQRAEIAEIWDGVGFAIATRPKFQCSSTSRNC